MTDEHARILLVHKNLMCVNKQDKEMYNIAIKAIEDNSQYKETIQNQDEMIRALINAQETLQKAMAEKDKEIEDLYKCLDKQILENHSQKAEIERLKNAYKQCAWERDVFSEIKE